MTERNDQINADQVWLGNRYLAKAEETGHTICLGGPRTGKTTLIENAARVAKKRNEPALVIDNFNEIPARLFDPECGDIVLSALDERSVPWSPLAELEGPADCDRIARAILGCGNRSGLDQYEQDYLNYVSACLLACWNLYQQGEEVNNRILSRFIIQNRKAGLFDYIDSDHPVVELFESGNEYRLGIVQADASIQSKPITMLGMDAGFDAFSIKRHVANADSAAFIFITARLEASHNGTDLAAVLGDIYADAVSRLDNDKRRWLLIDELGRFPPMYGIAESMPILGKNGLSIIATAQNLPQLRMQYGVDPVKTLLGNFHNTVVFETPDRETLELAKQEAVQ